MSDSNARSDSLIDIRSSWIIHPARPRQVSVQQVASTFDYADVFLPTPGSRYDLKWKDCINSPSSRVLCQSASSMNNKDDNEEDGSLLPRGLTQQMFPSVMEEEKKKETCLISGSNMWFGQDKIGLLGGIIVVFFFWRRETLSRIVVAAFFITQHIVQNVTQWNSSLIHLNETITKLKCR